MNQREALVTVIEFLQEQPLETRELKRAVKVLIKRAEVLRVRYERRWASVPDDITEEPLTISMVQINGFFLGDRCRICGKEKPRQYWFCVKCFDALDPQLRKALRGVTHDAYPHAFCRAVRLFRKP
jgi:hypothetical protein